MMNRDRRRYFRINDTVGVAYRVLTDAELASQPVMADYALDNGNPVSELDARIDVLLGLLRARDPHAGELIDLLNRKFNYLLNQINLDSKLVQQIAHKVQEVNISACGMAMVSDEELDSGVLLSLDLVLLPLNVHVFTRAIVIDSMPMESGSGFHVRMEFTGMETQDQEVLIQHIVQRQSQLIWALRNHEQKAERT